MPDCTAIEAFYLETSAVPIRFLLMGRRLLYLWDILQKSESELVKQVFISQKLFTVKNDWVLQVQSDLSECGIDLTENEISRMKRISYKKLICKKINLLSAQYLTGLNEHLKYSQEMQPYPRNESLNIEGKRLISNDNKTTILNVVFVLHLRSPNLTWFNVVISLVTMN